MTSPTPNFVHMRGPWRYESTGMAFRVFSAEWGGICKVFGSNEKCEDFARAIAELPTLLKALKRIAELTPRAANAATADDLHFTVKAIAETAIAASQSRAEGSVL